MESLRRATTHQLLTNFEPQQPPLTRQGHQAMDCLFGIDVLALYMGLHVQVLIHTIRYRPITCVPYGYLK